MPVMRIRFDADRDGNFKYTAQHQGEEPKRVVANVKRLRADLYVVEPSPGLTPTDELNIAMHIPEHRRAVEEMRREARRAGRSSNWLAELHSLVDTRAESA